MSDGINALRAQSSTPTTESTDAAELFRLVKESRLRERQDYYDKPSSDESVERSNPDLDFGAGAATEALPYVEEENVYEPLEHEPEHGVLDDFSNTVDLATESPTVDGFSPTVDDMIDSVEDAHSTVQFDIDG